MHYRSLRANLDRRFRDLASAEDGYVTIEAALGLSAVVIVVTLVIAGIVTVATYIAAIDTAAAAARAASLGQSYTPARGSVEISHDGDTMTAIARLPSFYGTMSAEARFPVEYLESP